MKIHFPAVLLCVAFFAGGAFALPPHPVLEKASPVIWVQEDTQLPGANHDVYRYEDCLRPGPVYNLDECVTFRRRYNASLAARTKEGQSGSAHSAEDVAVAATPKKTASKTSNGQDHTGTAVKTPASGVAQASPKAIAAKALPEKLRMMLGQLVMTGFAGREPEDPDVARAARDISEGKISGVILRDSNIENFQQLRQLLAAVTNFGSDMPALIAIDQPGGADTVLSEDKGFNFFNAANTVSSGNTPQDAQLLYRAMASDLSMLGVSLNIGPSEDVCRGDGINLSAPCFGTAPSRITAYARAFNLGHHDRGILTALRHTPFRAGLGTAPIRQPANIALLGHVARGETSDALVVRVKALDPLPFADLQLRLPHRKVHMRDGGAPGFPGALIFEVDIGPAGAPIRYEEILVRSLQAGADMILIREPSGIPQDFTALSLNAVQAALKSGRLSMARVEDAYNHVERLKSRLRVVQPRTKVAGLAH